MPTEAGQTASELQAEEALATGGPAGGLLGDPVTPLPFRSSSISQAFVPNSNQLTKID